MAQKNENNGHRCQRSRVSPGQISGECITLDCIQAVAIRIFYGRNQIPAEFGTIWIMKTADNS